MASYTNGAINSENYGAVVNDPERINSVVRGLTELAAIRNQQSQFPGDAELNLSGYPKKMLFSSAKKIITNLIQALDIVKAS